MSDYPAHWEADVVLTDGGTVHLRPITTDDADGLREFHGGLSAQTVYYRFFAPYPRLSDADVRRFTTVDQTARGALVAVLGGRIVGVARWDRYDKGRSDSAEVAFVVSDAHQRRGLGSVLLEHLAAAGSERGVRRFVAEVLPENRAMTRVFLDAGYEATRSYGDGLTHLEFPIAPTAQSVEVARSREHRAESRSIGRLLSPRSVAVVGASRQRDSEGFALLRNLLVGGFEGPVYPVNPATEHVASVKAYASLLDIPGEVDLAVVAVPAAAVEEVLAQAAEKSVRGLVIVSSGFGETGPAGAEAERRLVRLARASGMRVIGPNCLGVVNTDPAVSLNASLVPRRPERGRVGFFSQSGALGIQILEAVGRRGLGLSTFVSAGNRADVSGNDLLQYWEEDADTDVVLLYLESFGNPRKFARLARRVARSKPVVAVKSGRGVPRAHASGVNVPDSTVDALFRQAGVIRVDTLAQLFDTAQLLAYQPLPQGRRVAVVGNSTALGMLAADACERTGLELSDISAETAEVVRSVVGDATGGGLVDLGPRAGAEDFRRVLTAVVADPCVDAVVAVFIPALRTPGDAVAEALAAATVGGGKPVVATFLGLEGLPPALRREVDGVAGPGSVPSYSSPEAAVLALSRACGYAEWLRAPAGVQPELDGVDPAAARELVDAAMASAPEGCWLDEAQLTALLGSYGVRLWAHVEVDGVEAALAAAERVGWPVALKSTDEARRHRADIGGVRLGLVGPEDLRAAWDVVTGGSGAALVQAMAPSGVPTVVGVGEDPSFGPVVSFGVGGVATDLLGDRAYRILPLTDSDAAGLVRGVRAAPLLFGHRGSEPVDVAACEDLLLRLGRLAEDLPEVAELECNPVVVAADGLAVLSARCRLAPPVAPADLGPRRMR